MTFTGVSTMTRRPPSMIQTQPLTSLENDGSCWTCVARGIRCDKGLPGKGHALLLLIPQIVAHVLKEGMTVKAMLHDYIGTLETTPQMLTATRTTRF